MNEKKQPLGSILFNINEDHNIKLAKIKKNILVREHYNLDAIISVGYRVNSQRATQFRIWATKVLKQFAIKGYVLDKKRLENGNLWVQDKFGGYRFWDKIEALKFYHYCRLPENYYS